MAKNTAQSKINIARNTLCKYHQFFRFMYSIYFVVNVTSSPAYRSRENGRYHGRHSCTGAESRVFLDTLSANVRTAMTDLVEQFFCSTLDDKACTSCVPWLGLESGEVESVTEYLVTDDGLYWEKLQTSTFLSPVFEITSNTTRDTESDHSKYIQLLTCIQMNRQILCAFAVMDSPIIADLAQMNVC